MAKFRRALIEIGNVCNLRCPFCAESRRAPLFMSVDNFRLAAKQVRGFARVISLHLLGEPTMHPEFPAVIAAASELGLRVNLVTNGSMAYRFGDEVWKQKCLDQVTVSVQSLSCFSGRERELRLAALIDFAKRRSGDVRVSFRLRGALDGPFVRGISREIMKAFGKSGDWDGAGLVLAVGVFLNHGEIFDWRGGRKSNFPPCLGLRHHFGVLADGTVVPCCADYDGAMPLGNLFVTPLSDILSSERAVSLRRNIEKGNMPEYCRGCGFTMPS